MSDHRSSEVPSSSSTPGVRGVASSPSSSRLVEEDLWQRLSVRTRFEIRIEDEDDFDLERRMLKNPIYPEVCRVRPNLRGRSAGADFLKILAHLHKIFRRHFV